MIIKLNKTNIDYDFFILDIDRDRMERDRDKCGCGIKILINDQNVGNKFPKIDGESNVKNKMKKIFKSFVEEGR